MNSILEVVLSSLISSLPQIAIATVGLVLVHNRLRQSHPRAYLHGTLGMALLLANGLLGVAVRAYIQANAGQLHESAAWVNRLTMANLVSFVVLAASLVLILIALVADRNPDRSSRVAA
jgi:hypothetical protein